MKIEEGYMPFRDYKTYYRIVGEPSDKTPLLLLHGGLDHPIITLN